MSAVLEVIRYVAAGGALGALPWAFWWGAR